MYYRKPTELEKADYITASQIMARWGHSLRLTPQQVGKALGELGFQQEEKHKGRFWLVVERTVSEIKSILP